MNTNRFLIVVRHGDYGSGEDAPLTQSGREQIEKLNEVIRKFLRGVFEKWPGRLCFSFSHWPRALESIEGLRGYREDLVVTDLYMTNRESITEPEKIVTKVMQLAELYVYQAEVILIVAHGVMPAVLAETFRAMITGDTSQLPGPGCASGYIVNLVSGEITRIGPDGVEPLAESSTGVGVSSAKPASPGQSAKTEPISKPAEPDGDIPF